MLQKREELLRAVLRCAPVVLFSLDARGIVTLAEGRALAMAGKRATELVGTSPLERYAESEDVVRDIRRALRGEEFAAEHRIGEAILETHYRPLFDGRGQVAGTVGVSIDVTARKNAEAERAKMEAQLLQAQKLESLGVLAGGIAHDFNNLLTGILGNVSMALAEPMSPSTAHRLEDTLRIARNAAELTRQMLAYAGRTSSDVRALHLSAHVREIGRLLQSSLPKKVELRLDLADDLPAIEADSAQLQQVVMNLVINGAEAIGDAVGSVRVSTRVSEIDEAEPGLQVPIEGGVLPEQRFVLLEVEDTGRGMDDATQARIFDPFFTTKFTGRGLGLATVLGIVRSHRGTIRVDSAPGRGTRFRVFLPPSSKIATSSPPVEHVTPRGEGLVLIVDDEYYVRTTAARILGHFGFQTLVAANGREGVEVFRAHAESIDVVLLDMTMPDMDGSETFAELRKLRPDVCVVLSSGYAEAEARESLHSEGVVAFLQKPYSASDLGAQIKTALDAKSR